MPHFYHYFDTGSDMLIIQDKNIQGMLIVLNMLADSMLKTSPSLPVTLSSRSNYAYSTNPEKLEKI